MTTSAEHVVFARGAVDASVAYLEARWAGVAAVSEGINVCPFGEAEHALVEAYREGAAMARRQQPANVVRPAPHTHAHHTAPQD